MNKKIISSEDAPKAIGPYAQGIKLNNMVYISGQLGINVLDAQMTEGIENQTHQAMKNIGAILKEADLNYNNIVKTTIFLLDLSDFNKVNTIYESYFEAIYPARSCIEVSKLPKNGLIEIEVIAAE